MTILSPTNDLALLLDLNCSLISQSGRPRIVTFGASLDILSVKLRAFGNIHIVTKVCFIGLSLAVGIFHLFNPQALDMSHRFGSMLNERL